MGELSNEEFDRQFEEAREWLRTLPLKEAVALFRPEIAEATIKRLRGTHYNNFSSATRWGIVRAHRPEQRLTLYEHLAVLLAQDMSKDEIIKRYAGEYHDYRFACPVGDKMIYVSGRYNIYEDPNGDPSFQHWSRSYLADHGEESEAQHVGYVMVQNERLFLLGAGDGTLTMSICETFRPGKEQKDSVLRGVVLSTRSIPRDPFGATFILVHSDNTKGQETFDPKNPDGVEKFKNYFNADSPYYLKIH
jgi:hypothetical protein